MLKQKEKEFENQEQEVKDLKKSINSFFIITLFVYIFIKFYP